MGARISWIQRVSGTGHLGYRVIGDMPILGYQVYGVRSSVYGHVGGAQMVNIRDLGCGVCWHGPDRSK